MLILAVLVVCWWFNFGGYYYCFFGYCSWRFGILFLALLDVFLGCFLYYSWLFLTLSVQYHFISCLIGLITITEWSLWSWSNWFWTVHLFSYTFECVCVCVFIAIVSLVFWKLWPSPFFVCCHRNIYIQRTFLHVFMEYCLLHSVWILTLYS